MVLHDINQAIRFSDYLLIMKEGHIIDNGPTDQVLSKEILESVFNIDAVLGKIEQETTFSHLQFT